MADKQKPASKLAVVAAGGTGGHMFPAEALARELIDRGWRIVLASDTRGAAYAEHFPAVERLSLEAATFKRGDVISMIRAGLKIGTGVLQARKAFARLKPDAVIGFGGYPSYPALIAAITRSDTTLIHEQNSVLGRSNRELVTRVDAVACAFPTLKMASDALTGKVEVVGNPVRPDIRALYDKPYPDNFKPIRILVTGGSQGAKILSETVPQALALLPASLRIVLSVEQQTRAEQVEQAKAIYAEAGIEADIAPFFTNMAERLERAHLVVGRAGASTCCELAVAGKPSVLIPLKIAADNHQVHNAEVLQAAGGAVVILEDDANAESLSEAIKTLIDQPVRLKGMAVCARSVARADAAKRLADLVERTVAQKA